VAARQRPSLRHSPDRGRSVRVSSLAQLRLLGGFELETGRLSLDAPPNVQRLLAFLALQDRPVRRTYVSGRLWLVASQEQAFASLRTTLWRLRRVHAPLVEATSTHLALSHTVEVDSRELARSAERFLQRHHSLDEVDIDRLAKAHELLPDWYEDWVLLERERLSQLRLLALEAACEELVAAGSYREAATAAVAAVATDPLRESARRLLITAYVGAGDQAEAARQFVDFRVRLKRELGLEPSFRMLELARALGAAGSTRPASRPR
jgi:DNA-binding SARP family transcriptional activator